SWRPCWLAVWAIPQAIERLFATPMIKPRLPRIRPLASAMTSSPNATGSMACAPAISYGIGYQGHQASAPAGQAREYARAIGVEERRTPNGGDRGEKVSAFRNGVQAAIPALRRYARALTRDTEIADDLVQDTLVRALRSEHLFHEGDVRSWLYTILTNLNRNRLRTL